MGIPKDRLKITERSPKDEDRFLTLFAFKLYIYVVYIHIFKDIFYLHMSKKSSTFAPNLEE